MRHWLKEPLLHFLVAGALLFAAYGWFDQGGGETQVVRLTAAEVNWLRETWTRQWQRPPSEPELRGMVTDYLKEVLLAREARELGMDENDTIVRRRLAQKMEFLMQDTTSLMEPSEVDLRRIYDTGRADYQNPARISFNQIFYKTEAAAQAGLEQLKTHSAEEIGDQILLEHEYALVDEQSVAGLFGHEFARRIFELEPGRWHGPVASGYGFHLIWISERQDARPRPFEEVRDQVLNEWNRVQQAKLNEQYFAGLLKKYDVVVEESIKPLIGPLSESVQ